jgi:hypothetical protein
MNAFWLLNHAHDKWLEKERRQARLAEHPRDDYVALGKVMLFWGARTWGEGGAMRHSLSAAVIKYQA